jgi:hypothetical protein
MSLFSAHGQPRLFFDYRKSQKIRLDSTDLPQAVVANGRTLLTSSGLTLSSPNVRQAVRIRRYHCGVSLSAAGNPELVVGFPVTIIIETLAGVPIGRYTLSANANPIRSEVVLWVSLVEDSIDYDDVSTLAGMVDQWNIRTECFIRNTDAVNAHSVVFTEWGIFELLELR